MYKEVITEKFLQRQVALIGEEIYHRHHSSHDHVVFVGILNGAFMFFSDLVKQVNLPMEIDFLKVKSYEGRTQKEIVITQDINIDLTDKHVYVVDDIIDSGNTMKYVMDIVEHRGAKSVTPISVIYKENLVVPEALYILRQPEESPWFVGYGMDDEDGTARNLQSIYQKD